MNELALFAGVGGGILGGHLLGWRTVCAVEWEQYPASVLCARQNDKILPTFPIWDDVQTFDGKPWRGIVDVVSGGFPCQDISAAGGGAGITGERSGMWKHMARIIGEVRPQYVFVENSPMLTTRGLGVVLADLSQMGFDAKWGVVSAADVGANHQRERIWIRAKQRDFFSHSEHNGNGWREQQSESSQEADVVNSKSCGSGRNTGKLQAENEQQTSERQKGRVWQSDNASKSNGEMANANSQFRRPNEIRQQKRDSFRQSFGNSGLDANSKMADSTSIGQSGSGEYVKSVNTKTDTKRQTNYAESIGRPEFWATEPNVGRVADGVAARVDRLKAIGNGQVPLCAATAWELLK